MSVRFAGYAALFDRVDRGGDIVRRGAFARSLALMLEGKGASIPLLWHHWPATRIGTVEYAAEDRRGLRIIAALDADAAEPLGALRSATVTGLSFGYRVRHAQGSAPRELLDLDLVEISLVTMPMMPGAKVHMLR